MHVCSVDQEVIGVPVLRSGGLGGSKLLRPPGATLTKSVVNLVRAAAAAALLLGPALAQAQELPSGGTVAAGSASISPAHNGTLDINQTSNRAIINWNTYSIGPGGTVNYRQPSAASATLNRVTGDTPSSIAGTINAPGTVLLVNPNGIVITSSGVINTGSFAASTLDIKDSDFMSGNYKFTGNGAAAAVTNAGRINVSDGGFAALLGGHVANDGIITARLGHVALGSGELVTLDLSGDGFLSVAVPTKNLGKLTSADGKPLVSNSGKIIADGGVVELKAATAAGILRDAVNVPGSIRANSVGVRNGRIVLGGGAGGRVRVSGSLKTRGSDNSNGGTVSITGANVDLSGTIDASTTGVGRKGGDLSVVADDTLDFGGLILAEGGDGGAGGNVEISGGGSIIDNGLVILTAAHGMTGSLLIDPKDIYIANAAGLGNAPVGASAISTGTLEAQLAVANVRLDTSGGAGGTGNITLAAGSDLAWASANMLTLSADNAISIAGGITAPQGGLVLNAATSVTDTAAAHIAAQSINVRAGYVKSCRQLAHRWRINRPCGPRCGSSVSDSQHRERRSQGWLGRNFFGIRIRARIRPCYRPGCIRKRRAGRYLRGKFHHVTWR